MVRVCGFGSMPREYMTTEMYNFVTVEETPEKAAEAVRAKDRARKLREREGQRTKQVRQPLNAPAALLLAISRRHSH